MTESDLTLLLQSPELHKLKDRDWRLRNLYKIKDKYGQIVNFEPNWAQKTLLKPHYLNIVLKARQLGVTTYHAILFLDTCMFNPNINAAIVADSKPVAREIFMDKVKFAYDNLPPFIKQMCPAWRDNQNELRFKNGSVYRISTSLRGSSLQLLHITEFAKICQDNPRKADEIVSGALNAVQAGQFICIESTARGREGYFFDYCKEATAIEDSGQDLSQLDWKLFFFPWWEHPEYVLDPKGIIITQEYQDYFKELLVEGIELNDYQKAWYVKKAFTQGEYMKREYPSTPKEAFEAANEGFYFAKYLSQARKDRRICHLPYDDHARTFTAWDIGIGDHTAIWVYQVIGNEIHFIDYYENSDESLSHYVKWVQRLGFDFECHIMPHDAGYREKTTGKTYADVAREMGLKVQILERDKNEMFGIEAARHMMPRCWFDQTKAPEGIKSLESFRKEWNDKLGCYREKSLHNWASHGAKAFIYACQHIEKTTGNKGMTANEWAELRREYL